MGNDWKQIWEKRTLDERVIRGSDTDELFAALKETDGFDVLNGGLSLEALKEQYRRTMEMLGKEHEIASVYEVGCGCGANLLLLERDGIACGGLDYSEALIAIAGKVLKTKDIRCAEAIETAEEPRYDAVLSNSVISYFPDMDYAEKTLEKMCAKARYAVGLIDVHDMEKKDAYTAYRESMIENYEERYRNLPKLFYPRRFFEDFAQKRGMNAVFTKSEVENYWNNDFVFNCFLYKE